MSEIKVGDLRIFQGGEVCEIISVTKDFVIYQTRGIGYEAVSRIEDFIDTTPYQSPEPVKKIVAHVDPDGDIEFCFEGSDVFGHRSLPHHEWTRIELTPEMFGFN